MSSGKTLVAVATYNEIENLPTLVEQVFRYLPEADLLVVDDDSPDGTGQWAQRKAAEDPRLSCLRRERKLGLGTATVAAIQYALQRGYRYLVTMDADLSHPPQRLPALLAGMDPDRGPAVDVMIGSRYVRGGSVRGWGLRRLLISRAVNLFCRWALGLAPGDSSGAFRCYRTALLARLDLAALRSKGYAFQEEILFRLKRLGGRFGEIPILFVNRRRGASKVDLREAIAAIGYLLALGLENLLRASIAIR
ncbi:MAG: polyprenol monophosphomannose synthase [Thermoguttaceae bacterium]